MTLPFKFDFRNPDYPEVFAWRAERLQRLRARPELLPALLTYYRDNPAQMITDWGCTFDPRNAERGLPPVIPFILFPRQEEWVDWCMRKWLSQEPGPTVKSRDMGLSWLTMGLASCLAITRDDLVIGFGSRKEEYVDKIGSPKSLFHKGRMFVSLLPPELRGGFVLANTAPHMRLMFPTSGSAIVGEAGDGIGRGDRASIYFVDEAAFLERPQLVEASLSQTTNCRIDISTPNGPNNPFAEKVLSNKFDTFRFHWREDPRKDDAWYAKQCRLLDPVTVAQEIDINFSASIDGVLIPSAWIQSAIDAERKLGVLLRGERTSALDVADRGKDTCAQGRRDGLVLDRLDEWRGTTTDDIYGTTQRAFENCDDWQVSFLRFDSDGLGAGVRGDARVLNEHRVESRRHEIDVEGFHGGGEVVDKDIEFIPGYTDSNGQYHPGRTNGDFFDNYKAQCWWSLRERFRVTHEAITEDMEYTLDQLISIDPNLPLLPQLTTELSQPTYKKSNRGKLQIVKAPDGTKSPNLADMVMMLFAQQSAIAPPRSRVFSRKKVGA